MRGSAALFIGLLCTVSVFTLSIDDILKCLAFNLELCIENYYYEQITYLNMDIVRVTFQIDKFISDIPMSPETQCILTPGTKESGTVSLICSSLYPTDVVANTLQKMRKRRMIYLNCHRNYMSRLIQDKSPTSCYCYDWKTQTKSLMESESFNDSVTGIFSYQCNNSTLIMTSDNLREQDYVEVIILENTPFSSVSPNAFDDKASLLMVSFVNNLFTTRDLPAGLFCKNHKLRILQLEGQNFLQFPSHLFECTNSPCWPDLDTVVIRNTGISTLPQKLFGCAKNITQLVLSHNKIANVSTFKMQQLDTLKHLNLSHNVIVQLEPFAFGNFSKLMILDLGHNRITYLDNSWFLGLPSLDFLYLDNNIISALESCIYEFPLRGLSLRHNPLVILPDNVINGSKSLVILELQGNHLTILKRGSMNDLISIVSLDLSMNKISSFDSITEAFEKPAPSLTDLLLSQNKLQEIKQNALSLFPGLTMLYLNDNLIQYIHPLAFAATQNISVFRLDNNRISHITPNLFVYLSQLLFLNLANNSIYSLDNNVFRGLTSLYYLNLSQNSLKVITIKIFQFLPKINIILISGNLIEAIEKNAFPASIILLSIGQNRLSSLPCLEYENRLNIINMASNHVKMLQIPATCYIENLKKLYLGDNIIEIIAPGVLRGATSMQMLDLSNNRLDLNFSVNYFEGMQPLQINLSHNRITSLDNLLFHMPLRTVRELYLGANPITHIPRQLETRNAIHILDLPYCNISSLHQDSFLLMHMVSHINLNSNLIRVLPKLRFSSPAVSIELFDNPVECSCHMKWIKETNNSVKYDFNVCINPSNNSLDNFQTFPLEYFVCSSDIVCDKQLCECFSQDPGGPPSIVNCSQKHSATYPRVLASTAKLLYLHGNDYAEIKVLSASLEGYFQTQILTLNNCNIKRIETNAFQKFKYLEELYLHDNNLIVLPTGLFTPLKLLRILTLYNNHLVYLERQFLSSNQLIVDLRLNNNFLAMISEETRRIFKNLLYLKTLSLSGNPWECKCDNMSWKSWILDMKHRLKDQNDILCVDGLAVLVTPDENFLCPNAFTPDTGKGVAVLLPLSVIVIMAAGFYHRHMLAVFLFSAFGKRFRKKQEAEGCEYDVMLIYNYRNVDPNSDLDNAFSSVYKLMKTRFKVIYPDRDFDSLCDWPTEICKAISLTKKCVIVLSVALIEQSETMFIFDICHDMTIVRHSADLIIILDNKRTAKYIKKCDGADPRLKGYLRTNNFLIFGERHFYQRLWYLLPEPGYANIELDENIVDKGQDETLL